MANFDLVINRVLENEGDYSNDPDDIGGETKFGISQLAYSDLDIRSLTLEDAKVIYKRDYWDRVKGDKILNEYVAESIFDFAVNVGVKTASKLAQKVVYTEIDGVIGNKSITNINLTKQNVFIPSYKLEKIGYYLMIAKRRKSNEKFLIGWIKRALR